MTSHRPIKIAPSILAADFANFGPNVPRSKRRAQTGSMWM